MKRERLIIGVCMMLHPIIVLVVYILDSKNLVLLEVKSNAVEI